MKNKQQNKLIWYKWRSITAGGYSDWKYVHISESYKSAAKHYCKQLSLDQDGWSEHYRGFQHRKITRLPETILNEKIEECKSNLKAYQKELKDLREYAIKGNYNA